MVKGLVTSCWAKALEREREREKERNHESTRDRRVRESVSLAQILRLAPRIEMGIFRALE
jgi:hypothetical protein